MLCACILPALHTLHNLSAPLQVELRPSRHDGPHSRAPMSDWYNCTACAEYTHAPFNLVPSLGPRPSHDQTQAQAQA